MSRRRPSWRHIGIAAVLVGIALIYRSFLEQGHDWGDDFSLYINQARALVRGDVGQVVSDTRYILQNSGSDSFSPYVYPWGLPILLAPVYLVAGIDYRAFAWVMVISLVVFIWLFRRLIAPVIGSIGATSIAAVIALSTPYVWWSGSVTSDFPAIASVMVALWWIDRCRRHGHFATSARAPLVVVGLLATWAFAIRREVVVVLVAAAAVQALELRRARRRPRPTDTEGPEVASSDEGRSPRWLDVAAPYWSFALSTGAFHFALPASLEQQVDGGGAGQIWGNLTWYRDIFAEHVGLKEIGPNEIEVFGSHRLGLWLIGVLALSAVLGLGIAMLRRREAEFALAVYAVCVSWIILTQPFHEGRYIFVLTPMLLFFSWIAVSWLVSPGRGESSGRGALAALVPFLLVAPLIVQNADGFHHSWSYHREYDYIVHGPENPTAREMFDAVVRCTRGDDVVLFARARAMNLYTNRRAIQTGDVNLGLQRADWMVLSNDDVDYYEPKVNESNYSGYGLVKVWSNAEFTMYRVGGVLPGRVEACPAQ
ncbi:MAG: hypothetical protein ACKOQ1_08565 [Actinomycetota bacterium]